MYSPTGQHIFTAEEGPQPFYPFRGSSPFANDFLQRSEQVQMDHLIPSPSPSSLRPQTPYNKLCFPAENPLPSSSLSSPRFPYFQSDTFSGSSSWSSPLIPEGAVGYEFSTPTLDSLNDGFSELQVSPLPPSKPKKKQSKMFCSFCKRNGDRRDFYTTHILKDSQGQVVCPILREHVCEICGATGSFAHTRSYCPHAEKHRSEHVMSQALALKSTKRDSAGRVRRQFKF